MGQRIVPRGEETITTTTKRESPTERVLTTTHKLVSHPAHGPPTQQYGREYGDGDICGQETLELQGPKEPNSENLKGRKSKR